VTGGLERGAEGSRLAGKSCKGGWYVCQEQRAQLRLKNSANIVAEKDFSRILSDINGYGQVFLNTIREWNWFYDNLEYEAYYCPAFVKIFDSSINQTTIDLDTHKFVVHLETGDIAVTSYMIKDYTQVSSNLHHSEPLPLIEYMTIMGARCTEQDRRLKASTTFRNVHCIGHWI